MKRRFRWRKLGLGAGRVLASSCGKPEPARTPVAPPAVTVVGQPHAPAQRVPEARLRRREKVSPLREVSIEESGSAGRQPPAAGSAPIDRSARPANGSAALAEQALAQLAGVDPTAGPLTAQQAAALNDALQRLRAQGAAAVSTIGEFLEQNQEIDFDAMPGGEQMEYGTLRLGLIDTLAQIGGPGAVATAAQTLENTADPLEIALLSRILESEVPQQYRNAELNATREALVQAMTREWKGGDVSPLFETLQAIGDASVLPILKDAVGQWNYYATLALAGMPGGQGIPTLIELAQDPAIQALGKGDYALRPLAQAAVQYPEAARAVVEQARLNQIPDSAWPNVVAALAGTYIQYGNQIFGSTAPAPTSSDAELRQRLLILNDLLTVTANAPAKQLLQTAATGIANRLSAQSPVGRP